MKIKNLSNEVQFRPISHLFMYNPTINKESYMFLEIPGEKKQFTGNVQYFKSDDPEHKDNTFSGILGPGQDGIYDVEIPHVLPPDFRQGSELGSAHALAGASSPRFRALSQWASLRDCGLRRRVHQERYYRSPPIALPLVPRLCLGTHCARGSASSFDEQVAWQLQRGRASRQCVPRQSLGTRN